MVTDFIPEFVSYPLIGLNYQLSRTVLYKNGADSMGSKMSALVH